MTLEVDYLPVATAVGNNADSQSNFAGSGYQTLGFQDGIALPQQANKCWRQSSMFAAALANVISQRLQANVLDDGNLTNLITLIEETFLTGETIIINPATNNVSIPANVLEVGTVIEFTAAGSAATGAGISITFGPGSPFNIGEQLSFTANAYFIIRATIIIASSSEAVCFVYINQPGQTAVETVTAVNTINFASATPLNFNTVSGSVVWGPVRVEVHY